MPETITPLANGLGLRRRALGDRLKGVEFANETEETGGKRWRAHHVSNLLANRHNRGIPIVFKKAGRGGTGRQLPLEQTPR